MQVCRADPVGWDWWWPLYRILFDGHQEGLLYKENKGKDETVEAEYLGEDENQDPGLADLHTDVPLHTAGSQITQAGTELQKVRFSFLGFGSEDHYHQAIDGNYIDPDH